MTYAHRRGFTLTEIIITLVIFTGLMSMTFETLVSVKQMEVHGSIQDDMVVETEKVERLIGADMATSGWYFPASEDINGNGVLDTGEDLNTPANGLDTNVAFAEKTTFADDRFLRYYPYVTSASATDAGKAFLPRASIDPTAIAATAQNDLARYTPWTPLRTGLTSAGIQAIAARANLALPSTLTDHMVAPSSELVFLRTATGPWVANPTDADSQTSQDMVYFPATGTGSQSHDWRPDLGGDLTTVPQSGSNPARTLVLGASSYRDVSGSFEHYNYDSATHLTSGPYGVSAWGAFLDLTGSGRTLKLQWETITAKRQRLDPDAAADNPVLPVNLREFMYALIPSPSGVGRLVRAHSIVIRPNETDPALGVLVGNRITDIVAVRDDFTVTNSVLNVATHTYTDTDAYRALGDVSTRRCFVIDQVLSDNVARIRWKTRRHDGTLGVNQVRVQIVFARAAQRGEGLTRSLHWHESTSTFSMRASSEESDVTAAKAALETPTATKDIPFATGPTYLSF